VVDVLFFLLAICFTVFTLVDSLEQHIAPVPLAVDLVLGGLRCLGVWLRRRWPVGLAVIVGLFSVYSMSASGVALIALFTVAVHRRFAVVGPIAAGYALIPFLTVLVRPDIPVAPWWQVVLGVLCVAAVLAWGMFVRARRQSVRERARRIESEQELRVAQIRQSERNRIAREMHDVLAHRLSLLTLHAGALELRPDAVPEEVAQAAGVTGTVPARRWRTFAKSSACSARTAPGSVGPIQHRSGPSPPSSTSPTSSASRGALVCA
jgi:signal transduction histidine kinase